MPETGEQPGRAGGAGDGAVDGASVGEVRRPPWADQPGVAPEDLQRLWAPWRFGYIAGDGAVEGCPFCVLPERGPDHDRDSLILHRAAHTYVICNAWPYNPGHLMVVPYDHVDALGALEAETAAEVWELGQRCVAVLRDELDCEGVNLGMNLGVAAGAGIADHVHLHVVPRWAGDTNFMSVVGATRVLPRALQDLYEQLSPAFAGDSS